MSNVASNKAESGPFAKAALHLYRHGLAVIPVGGEDGKVPLVTWGKFKHPPGRDFLVKLIERHSLANIGVICHLSNVTVIDVDDPTLVKSILQRFGNTPLITGTPSGGVHLWYRHDGERCANLRDSEGIAVDVKGIGGFVVVPPSIRPNGPYAGEPYGFIDGSWGDLKRLPKLRPGSLSRERNAAEELHFLRAVKTGRRNDVLFKRLLREVRFCDDFDALLDVASSINAGLDPPLADAEVIKTARSAWKYEETGQNWAGCEARAIITAAEFELLKHNLNAYVLWAVLKLNHGARKEPFAVSPKAMSAASVIPGWGPRKYANARNWLVERKFLKVNHEGGARPRDAWLFTFSSPVIGKGAESAPNIIKHPFPLPLGKDIERAIAVV